MKTGRNLMELAAEIERRNNAKRDFIVDTHSLEMTLTDDLSPQLTLSDKGAFGINETAHRQIGEQLEIPSKYYGKMLEKNPGLLATNVNGWFRQEPKKRMLRTLDGTARAFLSDRYRRIDNYAVASAVLPIIGEISDARVESCELTDDHMYIKVINPRLTEEVTPGDIVQAGMVISNSEVGLGSVSVLPLVYRLVCTNGMIVNEAGKRKYHAGRRINTIEDNFELYRDETVRADDRAFLMKVQDIVHTAVDEAKFAYVVGKLRDAKDAKLEPDKVQSVVELTGKKYDIRDNEKEGILGYLIKGGDLSLYGLANAITRKSQDMDSYERATQLEGIGYEVITMEPSMWREINTADIKAA